MLLSIKEETASLNHDADPWGDKNKEGAVLPLKEFKFNRWRHTSEEAMYDFIKNSCKYKRKKSNSQIEN